MARPILCDTCQAVEAVLMVSVLANGTTVAVCGEHAPALLSTLGGTGSPEVCDLCKEETPRFTWTDHQTGDSLSSGEQCVLPYVAGLAESVGLVVTMPGENGLTEAPTAAPDESNGTDGGSVPDESATPAPTRKKARQRPAVVLDATDGDVPVIESTEEAVPSP